MVDDMLNVVLDPIFNFANLPNGGSYSSKYKLPGSLFSDTHKGYKDTENLFEHICNINE